jgi:hypothetical protein
MPKALRHHPLLAGTTEVLVDAARYVTIVLLVLLVLGSSRRSPSEAKGKQRAHWRVAQARAGAVSYWRDSGEVAALASGTVIRQIKPSLRQSSSTLPSYWYSMAWLSMLVPSQ